jgi:hypothetical protein
MNRLAWSLLLAGVCVFAVGTRIARATLADYVCNASTPNDDLCGAYTPITVCPKYGDVTIHCPEKLCYECDGTANVPYTHTCFPKPGEHCNKVGPSTDCGTNQKESCHIVDRSPLPSACACDPMTAQPVAGECKIFECTPEN